MSDEAVAEARAELAETEAVFGPDHPQTTKARIKVADALTHVGLYAEELPLRERILADRMAQFGAENSDTATACHNYGFNLYRNDRPLEGIPYMERAARDLAPFVLPNGPALFFLRRNLATVLDSAGRPADAIAMQEQMLEEQREDLKVDADGIRRVRLSLVSAYRTFSGPGQEQMRAKGEALWQLIVQTQEELSGADDPETLRLRNQFAVFYARTGQNRKALPLYQRILADRERVLGPEDSETLLSRSNLAICHDALDDRESAAKFFGPLYEQRLRLLGEDHDDTLDTLDRLAVCVYNLSRYEEAEKYFALLVEARSRLGGPDDRTRTNYLNWLGWSHYRAGHYKNSFKALSSCLEDRERILGADDPDTMAARHAVGDFLQAREEYDEAISVLERTLADRERILGPGKENTVKTRSLLAKALIADEQYDAGVARRREDVEAIEREYGPEDRKTILAVTRLGHAEKSAMLYPAALADYVRALTTAERVLGPEHPDTVPARYAVAVRYQGAARFAEAEPLFEQVLENYQRNYGAQDTRTLSIRWEIARCHDGAGHADQALEEYRALLADAERSLPENNWLRTNLAAELVEPPPSCWRTRETLTGHKLWQVALGAILRAEVADIGYTLDVLYTRHWLDRRQTVNDMSRWWGMRSREDLLGTQRRLATVGHRAGLVEALGHEPLAWDIARYANNVREGVAAGFIDETEAWDLYDEVTEVTAQTYDSWAAFTADYIAGRGQWLGLDGSESESDWPTAHRRKIEAVDRLLDPDNTASVFNRAPWDTVRKTEAP